MNLNDYQKQAITTDSYGAKKSSVTDPAFIAKILGLVGEAGEVAEKFKKIIRNKNGEMSAEDRQEIIKELGDTLWYISVISHYLDTDMETVAQTNLKKLSDRKDRGVIASQGDNR